MNWFMYVWLGGFVLLILSFVWLVCRAKKKLRQKWSGINWKYTALILLSIVIVAATPFVNVLYTISILCNMNKWIDSLIELMG